MWLYCIRNELTLSEALRSVWAHTPPIGTQLITICAPLEAPNLKSMFSTILLSKSQVLNFCPDYLKINFHVCNEPIMARKTILSMAKHYSNVVSPKLIYKVV